MWQFWNNGPKPRRRGAAAVFAMIMMVVLVGFAALTVDVGALYNTRADLQNAADAGAMAGAAAYASAAMTRIRIGNGSSDEFGQVDAMARRLAREASEKNWSFGSKGTRIMPEDITTGYIDAMSGTSPIDPAPASLKDYNAVQVITRRSKESPNGPLRLFFAPIFGVHATSVSASAVAIYDDHFSGYDVSVPDAAPLWPFTIHEDQWDNWLAVGTDDFAYDGNLNNVSSGRDGTVEVRLYPDKLAPGNYGLLNVGTPNQSTTALGVQIIDGVSENDLDHEVGTPVLTFYDDQGEPNTYQFSGNPGLKAALEDPINSRIGDIVGIFLHDNVKQGGSNTSYRIVGIRFVRVMHVRLNATKKKGLYVQPVTYNGPGVVTTAGAPSSDNAGRIQLVR